MAVTRYRAADVVTAAYNAALALVWMRHLHVGAAAWAIMAAHLAGTSLPLLVRQLPSTSGRPMRAVAMLYPLVLIGAFWTEIDLLRAFAPRSFDATVAGWDLAMFGDHLHLTWPATLSARWVTETIYGSYFAYYAVIFGPPLALLLQRRDRALRDAMTQLMVVFVGCYLMFIFFPVDGPQHFAPARPTVAADGFFPGMVAMARERGGSIGAAFPSSHVAIAVTAALIGWRHFPRWVAVLLSLEAVGVSIATFFTQNHYAIDAVAGAAWAVVVQCAVAPVRSRAGTTVLQPAAGMSREMRSLGGAP
jgi:hypothetical protein